MPLTMRPWSINCYVLSKVWFKCGSVDLRVADITSINKSIKSWLYADLLEKPSELVMCRPSTQGGLGVISIKHKSLAILIRTFLETAAIPNFRHNLFHSALFRYHVLGDTTLTNPGIPPYYSVRFFDYIKQVYDETPLNILTMSIGQWTKHLTEKELKIAIFENQLRYVPCRAELRSPDTLWSVSWKTFRLRGLSSDLISFNFKLLHGLLCTRQRLHHLNSVSPTCVLCNRQIEEDSEHALFWCEFNQNTGRILLQIVSRYTPEVTATMLLKLQLETLDVDLKFQLVWFTSTILQEIWNKRVSKSAIQLFDIRSTLEARCQLLRKNRAVYKTDALTDMINLL